MIKGFVALGACLLAMPVMAQETDPAQDVIIMRRVVAPQAQSSLLPTLPVEVRVGNTYFWYSACDGTTAVSMCLALPQVGGGLDMADDESRCGVPQNLLHRTFLASQSLLMMGDANAFKPAGTTPNLNCEASPTAGFGYRCDGEVLSCFAIDSQSYLSNPVAASECAAPQRSGDFSAVLDHFGFNAPGVDVTTACQATFLGRQDRCEPVDAGSGNGDQVMQLKQTCFAINTQNLTVSETSMNACSSTSEFVNASQMATLQSLDLVPARSGASTYCANDSGFKFTARVTSDVTTDIAGGRRMRRVDYSYQCSSDGAPVPASNCTVDFTVWRNAGQQFARDNDYELFSNGNNAAQTWYDEFTYTP